MEWVLLWFLFGFFSAIIAMNKNRSGCGWFLLGLLLGPFGLLVAALDDPTKGEPPGTVAPPELARLAAQEPEATKKCPFCAETIKRDAIVCRYCRRDLPDNRPETVAVEAIESSVEEHPALPESAAKADDLTEAARLATRHAAGGTSESQPKVPLNSWEKGFIFAALCAAIVGVGYALSLVNWPTTPAPEPAQEAPRPRLYIQSPVVNIRGGPGTENSIVQQLRAGDEVVERSRSENWIQIETPRGTMGWVYAPLVAATPPAKPSRSSPSPDSPAQPSNRENWCSSMKEDLVTGGLVAEIDPGTKNIWVSDDWYGLTYTQKVGVLDWSRKCYGIVRARSIMNNETVGRHGMTGYDFK